MNPDDSVIALRKTSTPDLPQLVGCAEFGFDVEGIDDLDEGLYDCVVSDPLFPSQATLTSDSAVLAVRGDAIDYNRDGIRDFFDLLAYLMAFDAAENP